MNTDKFGPINVQSGKVTKQPYEDKGKTAHREQAFNAPADRYFVEDSWIINVISANGKNAYVRIKEIVRKDISATLENGVKTTIKVVVSIIVEAHAETGSGLSVDVKTAWAEAEFSALTQEFA